MFGMTSKTEVNPRAVTDRAALAAFKNFGHAAARISKDAKASIIKSDDESAPGTPPHTRGRGGHNLRGAIRFDATKDDAVIGPLASFVGQAGQAHEFGGQFRGTDFPKRPFMQPALEQNIDRFAQEWASSI